MPSPVCLSVSLPLLSFISVLRLSLSYLSPPFSSISLYNSTNNPLHSVGFTFPLFKSDYFLSGLRVPLALRVSLRLGGVRGALWKQDQLYPTSTVLCDTVTPAEACGVPEEAQPEADCGPRLPQLPQEGQSTAPSTSSSVFNDRQWAAPRAGQGGSWSHGEGCYRALHEWVPRPRG